MALVVATTACVLPADACNMRRVANDEGMTNSAVLSVCEDSSGLLWIGTCDGVNLYDGYTVYPLSDIYPSTPLSGNIVEGILETAPGEMWIRTNFGINRLNTPTGELKVFPQFHGREKVRKHNDKLYLVGEDHHLYVFDPAIDDFTIVENATINRDSLFEIGFVADQLITFGYDGIKSIMLTFDNGRVTASKPVTVDATPLRYATPNGTEIVNVTADGIMRNFHFDTFMNDSVASLAALGKQRGEFASIINDRHGSWFVAFETDGVVRFDNNDPSTAYDLGVEVGVFCQLASNNQDVVWIGSDCRGLYTYSTDKIGLQSITFDQLGHRISHPVRSVYVDADNTLWLGTKGDGLLRVTDFSTATGGYSDLQLFTSGNSPLCHNMVFAIAPSFHRRLWIGTEEGINTYNYTTGRIEPVHTDANLRWVHGLYEQSDTVLWIATIGQGVWRAKLNPRDGSITSMKQYTVDDGKFASYYFFTLSVDSDGEPVFGNRGLGVFMLDHQADTLKLLPLRNTYDTKTVSDVFAVVRQGSKMWLGTGHGLLEQTADSERLYFGVQEGFVNSTIHSLVKADDNNLWISTNRGLVRLDPETGHTNIIDRLSGLRISEFSDGAGFLTPDSAVIFGGIDGIAVITTYPSFSDSGPYLPKIRLLGLSIGGDNEDLPRYYSYKENLLTLSHDDHYFALTFATPDFNNAYNSYSFSLDNREWLNNGNSNTISFTNMQPGLYKLYVKYINRQTGTESAVYMMNIRVTPPWYLSTPMKLLYLIAVLGLLGLLAYALVRRQKQRQAEALVALEQKHTEEVYEEKLKFFTNITHEFCTPLTLIYGPCERILSYEHSDGYIRKYVSLIRSNTERLNNLIQEIIDFRRIETGHNLRKVRHIDVSDLCNDIVESFSDLAERNGVTVVNEVEPDLTWDTDYRCVSKVITNLISNAFKYTPTGGTIRISLASADGKLRFSVYNTGKGIREEDKAKVFNRYAILDNVEENATRGLSARNGLGMAICQSMVDILEGTIEIDSRVGEYACFIVTLPSLDITESDEAPVKPAMPLPVSDTPEKAELPEKAVTVVKPDDATRRRILVVDDNEEMLTLLADSLSEYDVTTATDGSKALQLITESTPDLVITDIMMPGTDGLELTRQIKSNSHTMHVPLIILSAKNSNAEMIQGIESGADIYIGKPFSFSYLRAVISRLFDYNRQLREYYNSSASAFEYTGGQLVDREGKEFIDKVTSFIDANIDDANLSPDLLAQHLNTSVRNLYRKFKDLE